MDAATLVVVLFIYLLGVCTRYRATAALLDYKIVLYRLQNREVFLTCMSVHRCAYNWTHVYPYVV